MDTKVALKKKGLLMEIKAFFMNLPVKTYVNQKLESWVDDRVSDCCDWDHIECNTTTGRVIKLSPSSVNVIHSDYTVLNFTLFQPFEQLRSLDLSLSFFQGWIDSRGICELKNLVELNLQWNDFDGHLPACLNNLTNLRALDLSFNQLSGNLPSVIANLTSLEYLALQDNKFEATISIEGHLLKQLQLTCHSSFVRHQHSLRFIDLSDNGLVGMFPTWLLYNNTKLEGIYLKNNSFTGTLQLPNSKHDLLDLQISKNDLNGQLPEDIGTILPKLLHLDVSENSLEGHIPSSMGEMGKLKVLDLSSNNFSGELPSPFISGCFSLKMLRLSNNNFHGEIFPEFMNMTQLSWLCLDNNQFGGNIQDGLSKASLLRFLNLSDNVFFGQIPQWIGNLSNLEVLLMSNNLLEGGVPTQLSNMERLLFLDISENRLSGSLPSSFNLSSVRHLYMQKNAINGSIPNAIFRSSELLILDLRDNEFSVSIPSQLNNELSNLRFLLLGGNRLEGHIPDELCKLRSISILDLSHNRFNGTIPPCFTNMVFWADATEDEYNIITFSLSYGWRLDGIGFSLALDPDISGASVSYEKFEVEFLTKNRHESYMGRILYSMVGLDLSSNELTGDICSELGYLQNIRAMNLSHNFLSGSIPESFSHLKNIESLDLSSNKLGGQIPPQLTELYRLGTFNVSFNNLSGPIPSNGQFGSSVKSSYAGNPSLCGTQIKWTCSGEEATPADVGEEESAIDMISFYWSLFASYVTTIMGLVLILWLNSYWRMQWFCFIDACITSSYCWILRNVFHRYDDMVYK
ncbi:hypothetical protein Ddye_031282 [Dipteronia dyeriana]|uniref:Leucine-rich repeat-containing N-terminal plant-type domain-containing protein n=1 Tax=Dipteronia dyeriana TaxID=168575 RepID=A0AAD9TJ69_9ROSI|nr:hypothetical protein Ddye_031282 [Dipteronia dyeriana]